jgi:hypothetical protein
MSDARAFDLAAAAAALDAHGFDRRPTRSDETTLMASRDEGGAATIVIDHGGRFRLTMTRVVDERAEDLQPAPGFTARAVVETQRVTTVTGVAASLADLRALLSVWFPPERSVDDVPPANDEPRGADPRAL